MSETSKMFGRSYLGTGALELASNCKDKPFELKGLILETGRNFNELTTPGEEHTFTKLGLMP